MKKIIVTVLFLFVTTVTSAFAAESASLFESTIIINQDGSASIEEEIVYQTDSEKHGIFRYIPIDYNHDGVRKKLRFTNIKVTDQNEVPIPYEQTIDDGNLVLKIGDPDTTFSGEKTYVIAYDVNQVITQVGQQLLFNWDITGEGWHFPIEKTVAHIHSPFAKIEQAECFSGAYGGNDNLCTILENTDERNVFDLTYDVPVNYGDNVTVRLTLASQNQLQLPSITEVWLTTLRNNWQVLLIPIPTLLAFYLWFKKGRDWQFESSNIFNLEPNQPKHLKPLFGYQRTAMVYEPIRDLTPGEVGVMLDERSDNQDVISEIVDLARKKYLEIKPLEKKKLLGKETDFEIIRLKETDAALPKHQQYLLDALVGTKKSVKLSSLKGSFYTHMNEMKRMLTQSVYEKKFFTSSPTTIQIKYMIFYIIIAAIILMLSISWYEYINPLFAIVGLIASTLVALVFGFNMPQKTAIGTNLFMQAKGLKETLKRGAWRYKIQEKHLFIEEILPFAVSLGVVQQLTKDMDELSIEPPSYFAGFTGVHSANWSQNLHSFSSTAASGLSYNPSSSSSSSSGGFSGGGGGGGGGGSW